MPAILLTDLPRVLRLRPFRRTMRVATLLAAWALATLAGPARAQSPEAATAPALVGSTTSRAVPVDLAALKGQVVLLYFWSTDCPVCLERLPELRRNLAGWRGKPFVVLAINQDRRRESLQAYEQVLDTLVPPTAQMRILWRGAPGHHDGFGELPLNTPTTIVVDRAGRVVRQVRGAWAPDLWDDIADWVLN